MTTSQDIGLEIIPTAERRDAIGRKIRGDERREELLALFAVRKTGRANFSSITGPKNWTGQFLVNHLKSITITTPAAVTALTYDGFGRPRTITKTKTVAKTGQSNFL